MLNFKTNNDKILSSKIGYDTRICKEYGSLAVACLFNKAKLLCKEGEFGLSDQEFSNMLCLPRRTFERAKKTIKDRLSMRTGVGNKTYFSLSRDVAYEPIYYRSFELSHYPIMNNNLKGAAFLGQCLYWWNKALEKGSLEFSKTDKQIIEDLPFLSQDILTSIKKIAVLKGFITIKRKKRGSEWGVSHYRINPTRLEKSIKDLDQNTLHERLKNIASKQTIVAAKIPIECPPKSRLSVRQNPASTIIISIDNSILSRATDQTGEMGYERNEERKKLNNNIEEQPTALEEKKETNMKEDKMEEKKGIYEMIGIWKERVSSTEVINLSNALKFSLSTALAQKFDNSLDNWKTYCDLVSENDWLMGRNQKGWKVQLHWAIKFQNIDKVQAGSIYGKKNPASYQTAQRPILLDKQELLDEVNLSDLPTQIKELKVNIINLFGHFQKNVGLMSYHTYLRTAVFEVEEIGSKKNLVIKSSYGAFISLLSLHEILGKACLGFDVVMIYGGTNDRLGNQLFMRNTLEQNNQSDERLSVQKGIQSFMDASKTNRVNDFPERTVNLMK